MRKLKLLLLLLLSLALNTNAQKNSYIIKAKLKGIAANKQIFLAHYFGSNQYIKVDSAKNIDGLIEFKGSKELKGGIYLIVVAKEKFYDMIYSGNEKNIEVSADTSDFLNTVKFKGSKENVALYNYRKYLKSKSDAGLVLEKELTSGKITKEQAKEKMAVLQKSVANEMKVLAEKNKDLFVSKIIKVNSEIELPTNIPVLANGKKDSTYLFNYYKSHYFDNLDFNDIRMLNTPFVQNKIDGYFKNLVYLIPDSSMVDCDKVLAKAKKEKDMYRFVLWELTDKFEKTEVVGMEPVLVHLMENYYIKDASWLDSSSRARFVQRVKTLKPILPGKVLPNLSLSDTLNALHTIADINAKYTFVVFYKHDCGHCREHAPKIVEFAKNYKSKGIEVVMVDTENDLKKMNEFIKEFKCQDLLNLYDPYNTYNFYYDYDVYSTPTTYLLDSYKKILAKRIPIDDFAKYLEFLERQSKK